MVVITVSLYTFITLSLKHSLNAINVRIRYSAIQSTAEMSKMRPNEPLCILLGLTTNFKNLSSAEIISLIIMAGDKFSNGDLTFSAQAGWT